MQRRMAIRPCPDTYIPSYLNQTLRSNRRLPPIVLCVASQSYEMNSRVLEVLSSDNR